MRFTTIVSYTAVIACSIAVVLLGGSPALAERRVALVIGNSAYKNAAQLPNPKNDSAAITALFKAADFDVVDSYQNLGGNDMRRAIREFTNKVRDADIAVVFYAGHGIEVDGTNYLIPVDAKLEQDLDVEDEAIPLDRITKMLDSARRLRLVMLDACRDNPFLKTMKRTMGTRAVTRGLAKVEPTSTDTLIAFAAKAGSTAMDGTGPNSPFTTALLDNIATPGLDLRIAFGRVRDEVLKATSNKQEPFVYGSLGGTTVALVPPAAAGANAPASTTSPGVPASTFNPTYDIRRDYELASQVGTKEAWEAFLGTHKTGLYANLARAQLAKLNEEDAKKAKPQPAPHATPRTIESNQTAPAAPRSAEPPKKGGEIACDKNGCRELKQNCRVKQGVSSQANEGTIVCN